MHLHRSNDADALADALADLVRSAPLAWNQREIVAVQSSGMERWLSFRLADALGGVAAVDFPFPRAVVEEAIETILGEERGSLARWGDRQLTWAVLVVLPRLLGDPDFAPLARYLEGDDDAIVSARRLSLARELATILDRYVAYRPKRVLAWLRGDDVGAEDEPWQPKLLRAVRAELGCPCHAETMERAIARLRSDEPIVGLRPRISLFGVTTLPPIYLALLDALGRRTEVHLFWLVASQEYVADLPTARELRGEEDESGHPLLASLGKAARDFQRNVYETCTDLREEDDRFRPPERSTLLGRLRSDLFDLVPGGLRPERPAELLAPTDRSIVIHAAHGATRQVEALRDELVRAFDELPALEPRDVLVLTPDVDRFAPLVRAVFAEGDEPGARASGFPRIPVRVVEAAARDQEPTIDALLAIVELAGTRATAPAVVDVLARPAIAARFGLDAIEPALLRRYLDRTGIRWGIDAAHLASLGRPASTGHTFRDGLDRLLLGQLMRGSGQRAFEGLAPFDDARDRASVEATIEAIETIFAFVRELERPRTIVELVGLVERLIESTIAVREEDRAAVGDARAMLGALAIEGVRAGLERPLAPEAQRELLIATLTRSTGPSRFLGGSVTVAGLVPMRAIPFRVVCLLGLDEATFPRRSSARGFDLTRRRPEPGDRRVEDDDRAAFLEAILATQERLVLTYEGRDARSNEPLPLSVPVAELLDTLVRSSTLASLADDAPRAERDRAITARLVIEHALHPFSPRELAPEAPTTFDRARLVQALRKLAPALPPPRFVDAPLALPEPDEQGRLLVRIEDLSWFFHDPIRSFVRDRLRIELDPALEELRDREPYELDGRERRQLFDEVLALSREGLPAERQRAILRASRRLPAGIAGDRLLERLQRRADALLRAAEPIVGSGALPPLVLDATFDAIPVGDATPRVRVVGSVGQRYRAGRLRLVPYEDGLAQRLRAFVEHAVAGASSEHPEPTHLIFAADEGAHRVVLEPHPDDRAYVEGVLSAYLEGQRAPLPFTARAAEKFLKAKPERAASAARASIDEPPGGSRAEAPDFVRVFGRPAPDALFEGALDWPITPRFPALVDAIVRPVDEADPSRIHEEDP